MSDHVSEYSFKDLSDDDKLDAYKRVLKDARRSERVIDALCIMARSYPVHD